MTDAIAPETETTILATPEGDNEGLPDEPLKRNVPEITRPRGDEPHTDMPLRKALDE